MKWIIDIIYENEKIHLIVRKEVNTKEFRDNDFRELLKGFVESGLLTLNERLRINLNTRAIDEIDAMLSKGTRVHRVFQDVRDIINNLKRKYGNDGSIEVNIYSVSE